MNKTLIIAAAFMASVLVGCNKEQCTDCANKAEANTLSIAVINTDSLLQNYDYAKKLSDDLMNKEEVSTTEYNQKMRVFQQDVNEFQRKVQNNGFLSVERAQKEQQRLAKAEQDLQALNERLSMELAQENARVNQELRDSIYNFLNTYAKDKYTLVLSNSALNANVLYNVDEIDITKDVIDALNARYNGGK